VKTASPNISQKEGNNLVDSPNCCLISLWDMIQFAAQPFYWLLRFL
jgi:hypothetical protein